MSEEANVLYYSRLRQLQRITVAPEIHAHDWHTGPQERPPLLLLRGNGQLMCRQPL
jgi:hypothetical protein